MEIIFEIIYLYQMRRSCFNGQRIRRPRNCQVKLPIPAGNLLIIRHHLSTFMGKEKQKSGGLRQYKAEKVRLHQRDYRVHDEDKVQHVTDDEDHEDDLNAEEG